MQANKKQTFILTWATFSRTLLIIQATWLNLICMYFYNFVFQIPN